MFKTVGKWQTCFFVAAILLAGCGGGSSVGPGSTNLTGQVLQASATAPKVSHYAASRFLEHAAMGPSPTSVAQVRNLGIAGWIDAQTKLPASLISTPSTLINYDNNLDRTTAERAARFSNLSVMNNFVAGEDQLRLRVSWALSNLLVVSNRKIQAYGVNEYFNTLQRNAFGQYGDLLKAVTLSPAMGFYLDNGSNNRWNLNENYGRELMQLFSVGLVQLNLDGSAKRDTAGRPLETYSQGDVISATKALTGWSYVPRGTQPFVSDANGFNYGLSMVATNADSHDTTAKTVLGKSIPAGQSAAQDLDSLINILVTHPNTAPFVSLRLIQALTASDPSPAYLTRVATVFQQTSGNLAQVISAILLDSEARVGDAAGVASRVGRIKEPHLLLVSVERGLGCLSAIRSDWNIEQPWQSDQQQPFSADSVFNFYPPNHRAPGSGLLAPEQKTLNSQEFNSRLGAFGWRLGYLTRAADAGCDVQAVKDAVAQSDDKLLTLVSDRFFRGAMPAAVRQGLLEANAANLTNYRASPMTYVGALLDMASVTPAFGVTK